MAGMSFKDLLEQSKQWTDFNAFIEEAPQIISADVKQHVIEENQFITDIKNHPDFKKFDIRTISKENLEEAEKLLADGKVVGIDGTISKYKLFSGIRCQIGVIAANYKGEKIQHSFFISEASQHQNPLDAMERLAGRAASVARLSDLHLQGLMLYREREAGLSEKFGDRYIMFHGPLIPFEMISGLGAMRALPFTLEIMRKIISEKRFFSIISSSAFQDFVTIGKALERGQYLVAKNYTLGDHISTNENFFDETKWRETEMEGVRKFLRDYADKIQIGVIRMGDRPYVFHAHRETFDLAAAIIARDSMFQKEKGFPLLIDYVDTMCSRYFTASDFKRQVVWELAKSGAYVSEASEREMRKK